MSKIIVDFDEYNALQKTNDKLLNELKELKGRYEPCLRIKNTPIPFDSLSVLFHYRTDIKEKLKTMQSDNKCKDEWRMVNHNTTVTMDANAYSSVVEYYQSALEVVEKQIWLAIENRDNENY